MRGHIRKYFLKSGDKRWAVVFFCGKPITKDGGRKKIYRWTRGFKTEGSAQRALNQILKAADDGLYNEPTKQTLSEYLDRWLVAVQPNLASKTFERYKELVCLNIVPQLGDVKAFKATTPANRGLLYVDSEPWAKAFEGWPQRSNGFAHSSTA